MTLNVANQTYIQPPTKQSTDSGPTRAERPTTLRTKTLAIPGEAIRDQSNGSAAKLSPFNEQEEWAKISEIMAKFGTDYITEDMLTTSKGEQTRRSLSASRSMGSPMEAKSLTKQILANWLEDVGLAEHQQVLTDHGFDDIDFLVCTALSIFYLN